MSYPPTAVQTVRDGHVVYASKTGKHRTVRLLAPLAADSEEWRLACGRPSAKSLVFRGLDIDNWRARAFARALDAAGIEDARIYDLRHSFASLLLAEARNVIDAARQLGHGAQLTLGTYGHVMGSSTVASGSTPRGPSWQPARAALPMRAEDSR